MLPVWSTTAFWIPRKPLHLRVCSGNQWDAPKTAMPAAGIGQQKGPNSSPQCPTACCTTNTSKVEWIGLWRFASSSIFTWPLANLFKHLDNFFQGKLFHNQQEAENAFQAFAESWSMDFYVTEINKLISHWQKCVLTGPILMNKDVFEPSYNDLNFTVWNCYHLFTNQY